MREVARAGEELEPARGDRRVRGVRVRDRDDSVLLAPHDHRRHLGGEVETVGGAHALAARVDDGAQRVNEGAAAVRVAERGVAAPDLLEVRSEERRVGKGGRYGW